MSRILGEVTFPGQRTPPKFVEVDSIPVIVNLVVAHLYVSVLPRGSLPGTVGEVEVLDLHPRFNLPLWLIWELTDSVRRFSRQILSVIAEL